MQQAHHAASVANRLLEPHDGLVVALAAVFGQRDILGQTGALVGSGDGEDQQQGVGRARDEGEELGFCEAVDIVDGEVGLEAEVVEELGHQLWIGFQRDEGYATGI